MEQEIKSITTPTTTLSPNTWGYRVADSHEYQPISLTPALITTAPAGFGTNDTKYDYHFGYNIDTNLPAGAYTNTLIFSAIASPAQVQGLLGINYMQDMTTNVCKETIGTNFSTTKDSNGSYIITPGSEPTKQLIDIRDGKEYWVAKLADGNCWMVQNLAYDLVKGKVLTPSDTDITTNWPIPTTTETAIPAKDNAAASTVAYRSWNLGEYVFATPATNAICLQPGGNTNDSVLAGSTPDRCNGIQKVEGWAPTLQAQAGFWRGIQNDLVAADFDFKTYDAHYLMGNYYQSSTAMAGSFGALVSPNDASSHTQLKDAASSICPKGWKLPVSGFNNVDKVAFDRNGSFFHLLKFYGYQNKDFVYYSSNSSYRAPMLYGDINGASQFIAKSPIYNVRAGVIFLTGGSLFEAEYTASYASSTASATANLPYGWASTYAYIFPTGPGNQYQFGRTVRCLAK